MDCAVGGGSLAGGLAWDPMLQWQQLSPPGCDHMERGAHMLLLQALSSLPWAVSGLGLQHENSPNSTLPCKSAGQGGVSSFLAQESKIY